MRKYLIFSILLICLFKIPWQEININLYANRSGADAHSNSLQFNQSVTPTAIPSTEKPVKTPHLLPTHAPRATAIPPEIPPPTDRSLLHTMILFGVIACLTVVIGLWINLRRINPR